MTIKLVDNTHFALFRRDRCWIFNPHTKIRTAKDELDQEFQRRMAINLFSNIPEVKDDTTME
jgi:hypothetical protein